MTQQATGTQGQYSVKLTAYRDCDDVFLCWRTFDNNVPEKEVPNNLGFMIDRQRKDDSGNWGAPEILRNRVGFTDVPPANEDDKSQPTDIWPYQRYDWTDHGANSGQTVRYRISLMQLPAGGAVGTTQLAPILNPAGLRQLTCGRCTKTVCRLSSIAARSCLSTWRGLPE